MTDSIPKLIRQIAGVIVAVALFALILNHLFALPAI